MTASAPTVAITVPTVLPSSQDPRYASENFTAERLAAIATISGRLVAQLSRHPEEQEIAILPGMVLLPVGFVTVPGLDNDVVLLAEPGTAPGLPATSDELKETVMQQITVALGRSPVAVLSPGRFTPRMA
jgi:hypothetical protein